jgi:LysM repeat protein
VCLLSQVGQVVCIKPTSTCAQTYTVVSGDTCYAIYTKYGLTEAEFLALNPSINCGSLQVGQVVCVGSGIPPTPTPPSGSFKVGVGPPVA